MLDLQPYLADYGQHDAHEFVDFFLHHLHEGCAVHSPLVLESTEDVLGTATRRCIAGGGKDLEVGKELMSMSIIDDIFKGMTSVMRL